MSPKENPMSSVYFIQEAGRGIAVSRSSDTAEDVHLGSVDLAAYHADATVRERFAELVAAITAYRGRTCTVEVAERETQIAQLPCSTCSDPRAADVLHLARQVSDLSDLPMSASGRFPMGCCKVHTVGAYGGRPDLPQPTGRRGLRW
jgi:hypothetical protein